MARQRVELPAIDIRADFRAAIRRATRKPIATGVAPVVGEVCGGTVCGTRDHTSGRKLMHVITIVLLIIAALCFLGGAVGTKSRVNLVAAGLLAWVLSVLIPELF
jgi:hypothetical protein